MIEPKLRFKADDGSQFPDWEKKKLEDVVEFLDGQRKPLEAGQRVSGKYPYYGASGIIDYVEDYIFDEELILLSEDGANILDRNYRVCFLAKGKYWVNNHAHVLRAMDGNVNGFICEQLETFDYRKYNSGGAQPKLNQATCRAIIMNMPSLPEQQKIADFLSTIDTVIEKQKETVSAWEERKKGVMQKLFGQKVRFKADDGSDFPEWEEKKIDDVATCFAGATPSTKIPEYWEEGTIRWMSSGEVNNGQIHDTEKRISQLGFDKCSTKMVKPNSVVMALAGQGKTRGMVAITRVPLCTNQSLCAIETNDDICDDYLYQYLQTQYNNLRLISSGDGTRGGLNLKLVGGYVVIVPCLAEQQKIADCLSSLDEVIEKQKATLAAWEELKKGLLQQMFV